MRNNVYKSLENKLIVSCQALENEPLYSPETMILMAKASIEGGASALRANSLQNIRQFKHFFNVPIIGLIKKEYPDSQVYITPTTKEIKAIAIAGADIIATDATNRKRPNNTSLKELVNTIHNYKLLAMADISTFEEGENAEQLGFDFIGTTLSGYTTYSKQTDDPDFELLEKLTKNLNTPIIMEGKIWKPEQLKTAFQLGAFAVVVGSAITRPQLITKKYSALQPL